MDIEEFLEEGRRLAKALYIFKDIEVLDKTDHTIKFRLLIDIDLYVQVYVNAQKAKTNFVLICRGERLYGRDSEGGQRHRHPFGDPLGHDFGEEGLREVSLEEFVSEIQQFLEDSGLL